MEILTLTSVPTGGWTKTELKNRMDQLLDNIYQSAKYGEKTILEEEDSKLEVQNIQKTLKDSYNFLKDIYDGMTEEVLTPETSGPQRMQRKMSADFGI